MKNNSKKFKAFSLIELSIVILIIGILVAGVTSSSRLITRMKLVTAQNLTRNSPVSTIKDLTLWYETSLDESFDTAEESDGSTITTWFDLNTQSSFKINAVQTTADNKPKYKINIINGLPGIYFDGSNDFFLVPSPGISGKSLSVFIVGMRTSFLGQFGLVSGVSTTTYWETDQTGFQAYFDNGGNISTGAASAWLSNVTSANPGNSTPFIYSTIFNGLTNINYLNTNAGSPVNVTPIFNIDRIYLASRYGGGTNYYFFNGHICEIIIFNRGLNTEERLAVNGYLSRKYAIKVS
jgi:prepilin-type N-terminal cleavage/methylation domain-containing protein